MSQFPIVCMAGGHRFTVAKVTADLRCACGSDDLDLDLSAEAGAAPNSGTPSSCKFCDKSPVLRARWMSSSGDSVIETGYYCEDHRGAARNWSGDVETSRVGSRSASFETDPEMGRVQETTSVTQRAKCSTCFAEHEVTSTDPAQPMPECPTCGAKTLTPAAGSTLATKTASSIALTNDGDMQQFVEDTTGSALTVRLRLVPVSDDYNRPVPDGKKGTFEVYEGAVQEVIDGSARLINAQDFCCSQQEMSMVAASTYSWVISRLGQMKFERGREAKIAARDLACGRCGHTWSSRAQYRIKCPECGAEESVREARRTTVEGSLDAAFAVLTAEGTAIEPYTGTCKWCGSTSLTQTVRSGEGASKGSWLDNGMDRWECDACKAPYQRPASERTAKAQAEQHTAAARDLVCGRCGHEWSSRAQYRIQCPECGAEESVRQAAKNDPRLSETREIRLSKIREITDGVLATNPGMTRLEAARVARRTVKTYPNILAPRREV